MGFYHSIILIYHSYERKLLWTISDSRERIAYSHVKWEIMLAACCLFEIPSQGAQVGAFEGPGYLRKQERKSFAIKVLMFITRLHREDTLFRLDCSRLWMFLNACVQAQAHTGSVLSPAMEGSKQRNRFTQEF